MFAPSDTIVHSDLASLKATRKTAMRLLSAIGHYQDRVRRFVKDKYVEFKPSEITAKTLIEDGEKLWKESDDLMQTAGRETYDSMVQAACEVVTYLHSINEICLGLRVSLRILQIDIAFQSTEKAHADSNYDEALCLIEKLKLLIYDGSDTDEVERIFRKCDCYSTIKMKFNTKSESVQDNLQTKFERLVKVETRLYTTSKSVSLEISKDSMLLKSTAATVFRSAYNPISFCKNLLENYFEPLIKKPVSVHVNADNEEYKILTLSYALQDIPENDPLRPPAKQVLEHLKTILDLLSEFNAPISNDMYVLTVIGEYTKEKLLRPLVNECLLKEIPQTFNEIEKSTLLADVIEFQQMLIDMHFIKIETDVILKDFIDNYNINCRTGLYKRVIDGAKEIMQKDLQDMIAVGSSHLPNDVLKDQLSIPSCYISKSTLEYASLIERIIAQTRVARVNGSDNYLQDLVPMLLEAYMAEMPIKHKRLLECIPQQSALYFNNCMYLSHWVAEHPDIRLPSAALALKEISKQYFDEQVEKQRSILADIMSKLDPTDTPEIHTIGTGPVKIVRQCLRQMELLCNVWLHVLPVDIYIQSFSYIVDGFLEKFINVIIAMEDIPTTVGIELSNIIDDILTRISKFFHNPEDVWNARYWDKFNQLKMILNGSLKDILNQWNDTSNSLSINYTSDELKRLVRAAFQNTDRRARTLMAIGL